MAANEILTFILGKEEYGVNILAVKEIRCWSPVTELPNVPYFFKGVINLRGTIIPVVDLRERFGLKVGTYTDTTVMIILQNIEQRNDTHIGIVVDGVSDVYEPDEADIKKAPEMGSKVDRCFINGMVTIDEKIIILLDSDKLLNADEVFNSIGLEEVV